MNLATKHSVRLCRNFIPPALLTALLITVFDTSKLSHLLILSIITPVASYLLFISVHTLLRTFTEEKRIYSIKPSKIKWRGVLGGMFSMSLLSFGQYILLASHIHSSTNVSFVVVL